jgi:hypothetical protein
MSAFPNTGRSEYLKLENLSGCFRPEADLKKIEFDVIFRIGKTGRLKELA